MNVRTSAKAIIIEDSKLLTIRCYSENYREEFFILPGGGQEHNEPLHQTVLRECREEINVDVEVHNLLHIREYIGRNHGFEKHAHFHQIDFMFLCTIIRDRPSVGHTPDSQQTGIAWLNLAEIEELNFYPHAMRPIFAAMNSANTPSNYPIYLGDIN